MAREMELQYAVGGNSVDVAERVEAMIKGTHENVVDVEQDTAVGLLGHRGQKFPLLKPRRAKRHVAGGFSARLRKTARCRIA